MRNKIKSKLTVRNILLLASALFALIGWIIYLVVSTTGYFAGGKPNAVVVTLSIFFLLGICAFVAFDDKLKKFDTLFFFVFAAFIILSFTFFVLDKEEVIGDRRIPVNHPIKEIQAVKASITGIVFYLISFLLLTVSSFFSGKKKEAVAA